MPYRVMKKDKIEGIESDEDFEFFVVEEEIPIEQEEPVEEKETKSKKSVSAKRKVYHNEIERQRRHKINTWITELGQLITEGQDEGPSLSKIQILEKACQFVKQSKGKNRKMRDELRVAVCENRLLKHENEKLKKELKEAKKKETS